MLFSLFRELPRNFLACFRWTNVVAGAAAGLVTFVLVHFGFDWWYFEQTRGETFLAFGLPAAIVGFFIPILVPVLLYWFGERTERPEVARAGVVVAQAELVGWLLSSLLKVFTGRLQPEFYTHLTNVDTSHTFLFGFWRHGIFWGWPSSHTTVAVAMAVVLLRLYGKNKFVAVLAILYAAYIALGVSVSIHWFSDMIAGVVFGIIVGSSVLLRQQSKPASSK